MMLELISVAAFFLIVCLVWLIARAVLRLQSDPVRDRLVFAAEAEMGGQAEVGNEALLDSLAGQIPETPFDNGELDKDLRRAGYYRPAARREFLAVRNLLVIVAVLLTLAVIVMIGPERQDVVLRVVFGGLILAVLCWAGPRILLAAKGRQRVQKIRRGMPDALDMLAMCLQGGLSLQDVLSHVSQHLSASHYDLALELLIVRHQADMNSLSFAFDQFARRVDAPETVALAALVEQNQRLGTNVAEAVREYADGMRLARRQRVELAAGRSQLLVLFPVVLLLAPAVLLLLWGPALLEMSAFINSFDSASSVMDGITQ